MKHANFDNIHNLEKMMIEICRASFVDLPEFFTLRRAAFAHFAPAAYSPTEVETLLDDIDLESTKALIANGTLFLVRQNGLLVGSAGWDGDAIRHVYVDPAHTRKGLATRLLAYAEEDFRNRTGKSEIQAGVTLYAKAFYERNGYIVINEAKDWDGSRYYEMKKTFE